MTTASNPIMPEWKQEIRQRLAGLHLAPAREAAIVEELAQYLEDYYDELLAGGYSETEAYDGTLAELSGSEMLQRELRRMERQVTPEPIWMRTNRRTNMIADLWQDLRYGARMLLKNPIFTLIAIATLGLGIGANTAIFSMVNAVLLRSFPYGDAERLVVLWEKESKNEQNVISPANFYDWQERQSVFAGMAAFTDTRTSISGDGAPEEIAGQVATDNLFSVLGVNALLGRTFTPDDSKPGQNTVVVLSYGLWQRRFGADPNVIGRKVILNAVEHTVIGVTPPDFKWHVRKNSQTGQVAELWSPWAITPGFKQWRGRFICAVARLKPGVTLSQSRAEMDAIASRLAEEYKQFNRGYGVNLVPLREQFAGEIRRALLVLMGAVGFVLLIACANVANLLLARAAARQKEIAVRAAMGASRGRIVRQLLTESVLLATMGGGAGLLLAWLGASALVKLSPPELGDFQQVEISLPVLGFTFAIAVLTGVIFGLVPALEASNIKLNDTLKEAGRSLAGASRGLRLRNALVVAEVALALVLLVGAGLLIRSFLRLQGLETGFNARGVLTMRVALPNARYNDEAKRVGFFTQALERMRALPGVEAAGAINYTPFLGLGARTGFDIEGRAKPQPDQPTGTTDVCVTDQDFFHALEIPLRRGRLFTEQEVRERRNVVVINEALAKKYFPNEDPLGKRLLIPLRPPLAPTEIIGVVGDAKHTRLDQPAEPMSYWPIAQQPYHFMTFTLRTRGDATAVAVAVRNVIQTLDPQQSVSAARTLDSLVGNTIARQRFNTLLLAVFAVVALSLSAIGIYGVMTYSVAQRRHELGVRIALGAGARDVLKLVLGQGMKLALAGVGIGLLGALALTRLLKTLLFDVSAADPLTFAVIASSLSIVALLACYLPARRATKVDPMAALHCD
jgi:putative ABC transport system permease protein